MKKLKLYLIPLALSVTLCACSQVNSNKTTNNNTLNSNKMDLSKISNENVKKAIEALQANDLKTWYSYFTSDAQFTDDGNSLDFKSFFENAFDKKERFLDIDKVENDGKDIYGNFYAGQWGTFRVYFKFHQNSDGKFHKLDIGQVSKL